MRTLEIEILNKIANLEEGTVEIHCNNAVFCALKKYSKSSHTIPELITYKNSCVYFLGAILKIDNTVAEHCLYISPSGVSFNIGEYFADKA